MYYESELTHYGVFGMKWGGRGRYQNPDGSLKYAGKRRYSDDDISKAEKKLARDKKNMSNKHYKLWEARK